MEVSLSAWFVILLAVVAASLPFLNERVLGLIALARPEKPFWLRLLEMLVLYGIVGLIAYGLESRIGGVAPQGWEFYAISGCLFAVLGYPGFVYRYLRKRHD